VLWQPEDGITIEEERVCALVEGAKMARCLGGKHSFPDLAAELLLDHQFIQSFFTVTIANTLFPFLKKNPFISGSCLVSSLVYP
jgi:hypothetical protein